MLKPHQIARISSTARFAKIVDQFGLNYPILTTSNKPRENPLSPDPTKLSIVDSVIVRTIMFKQQDMAVDFVGQEFGQLYLEDEFLNGAVIAINTFFDRLTYKPDEYPPLDAFVTPSLYKAFQKEHDRLKKEGVVLDVRVNRFNNVTRGNIFLQVGEKELVSTTLVKAPIFRWVVPTKAWRYDKATDRYFYRSAFYEYQLSHSIDAKRFAWQEHELKDSEAPSPSHEGAVIGIEVYADVDASIFLEDPKGYEAQAICPIRKSVLFRLESAHTKSSERYWKIADVDNYLANQVLI